MTLIDDYLRAVALLLPKDKRDDIIEELRELILSRIEAREAELHRKLTDDETEAVLRQIGHPLVVAARYRDEAQQVVGPTLYPYWMFAVKVAITLQVAVAAVVFIVRAVTGVEVVRAFDQAVGSAITGSIMLIGIATIAAWLIERNAVHVRYLDRWRVRDLRFLELAAWDPEAWRTWFDTHAARHDGARDGARAERPAADPSTSRGAEPMPSASTYSYAWDRSRGRRDPDYGYHVRRWGHSPVTHGLAGVAAGIVLLLWWVGGIHFGVANGVEDFRVLGLEPGGLATIDWAALKASLYLPVLAYVGLVVAQGAVRIAHPDALRVQGILDIAIGGVVLATVAWLWGLSPIASAVQVDTLAGFAQRMRDTFRDGPPFPLAGVLTLVLVFVGFGGVIRGVKGLFGLVLPHPAYGPMPHGRPI